jgi:hypothetical protein
MISTKLPMTAQIPSGFAMPISDATSRGTGLGMATGTTACPAPTYIVRDRHVAGATRIQGAVPGPTWSPPTC